MDSTQEAAFKTRKRYKLSFVCQLCRKSKTKCDRKKPVCGRCDRLNKPCVYDLEYQTLPRKPNKDATLARLQKELEYWKYFAKAKLMEKKQGTTANNHENPVGTERRGNKIAKDHIINLANFHPQLFYQDSRFNELKVFTNMAQIKHDCFLATLLGTFVASTPKEELLRNVSPYLTFNLDNDNPKYIDRVLHLRQSLLMRFTTETQCNRIQDFTDRLLTGREVLINYQTAFFVTMFSNVFFRCKIGDSKKPNGEYPPHLEQLISDANALLPNKNALLLYKRYFYLRLYHIYPYFDIKLFESALNEILVQDPERPNRLKFSMGTSNFRYKLSNVALLLLILKLSYYSLQSVIDTDYNAEFCSSDFLKQNQVSDQCIVFAEICLAKMCVFGGTNEVQISCLLFIWVFFCVGNGDVDGVFGRATDMVTEMLSNLAIDNGLSRDPSQFQEYQQYPSVGYRLQNFRRKLSLNVIITSVYSGLLMGNFSSSIWDDAKNFLRLNGGHDEYMGLVRRSMGEEVDPFELKIHSVLFKNYKMLVLLMDFEKLVKKDAAGLSLSEIDFTTRSVLDALNLNFSMDFDYIGGPKSFSVVLSHNEGGGVSAKDGGRSRNDCSPSSITSSSSSSNTNSNSNSNSSFSSNSNPNSIVCDVIDSYHNIQMHILVRNLMIHLFKSLFLYFEDSCAMGNVENLVHYKRYLLEATRHTLELAKLSLQILEGVFDRVLTDGSNMEKCKLSIETVFPTILYSLLGFGMRLAHAEVGIAQNIDTFSASRTIPMNDVDVDIEIDVSALKKRLKLLSQLRKDTFYAIRRLADAMSASFQYKNFCTFRTLLFLDAVIKLDMSEGLMDMVYYALEPRNNVFGDQHEDMKQLFTHTLGLNVDRPQEMITKLENAQFFSVIDEKFLEETASLMRSLGFSQNALLQASHTLIGVQGR